MTLRPRAICALVVALSACSGSEQGCSGTLVTVPQSSAQGDAISQLMAQAAAMGMTLEEAQTLIYLEGLTPQATLRPGERICLDGKPDAR